MVVSAGHAEPVSPAVALSVLLAVVVSVSPAVALSVLLAVVVSVSPAVALSDLLAVAVTVSPVVTQPVLLAVAVTVSPVVTQPVLLAVAVTVSPAVAQPVLLAVAVTVSPVVAQSVLQAVAEYSHHGHDIACAGDALSTDGYAGISECSMDNHGGEYAAVVSLPRSSHGSCDSSGKHGDAGRNRHGHGDNR
ncbi:MAG: hypothetical protein PVF75_10600 [Granulosicoccaceae bacterium]